MVKRVSWLSVTPEPERELPWTVATLRHGRDPGAEVIASEEARIERILLHGSQRQWLAYLHEVVDLVDRQSGSDPVLEKARTRAVAVIANHHNLLLGLPGRAAARTAEDRSRLGMLAQ